MSQKTLIIIGLVLVIGIVTVVVINNSKPAETNSLQANMNTSNNQAKTAAPEFETISTVQDLNTRLAQKNPNEILLDVRTPDEFAQGHIANALNIDMENPNFTSEITKLDKSKTYIVFCRSGNRALTASKTMITNGLKVIYSKDGITAWIAAKLPIIK